MLDFSSWIDLPLAWGLILAAAVFLYVVLDGFDLGCGILFPFAPSDECRSKIMNSIAPFWDGNETWLVLGGGGLFAAFPLAYSIIMPAMYLPIFLMLFGLVFRGVAFEFRFKSSGLQRKLWDAAFHGGSLLAAFMQGIILGNFVIGFEVSGRAFSGGSLDWANGFSLFTGMGLVFGYGLLGATWLILKTHGQTQAWAYRCALYCSIFVALMMVVLSGTMPLIDRRIALLWLSLRNFFWLLPIPLMTLGAFYLLWIHLHRKNEKPPFFLAIAIFFLGYLGLGISLYPWIVPHSISLWQAAAAPESQSLLFIGTALMLPIILGYTAYSYYIFRGKSDANSMYP